MVYGSFSVAAAAWHGPCCLPMRPRKVHVSATCPSSTHQIKLMASVHAIDPDAARYGGRSCDCVRAGARPAAALPRMRTPRCSRRRRKTSSPTFIALFVIFVVPVVLIVLFWMVHILPEKIAHKRHHPQFEAIRTLCLLSLVFGGLLWPLAWIWAYSKPVMYKMAYGTDKHPRCTEGHAGARRPTRRASESARPAGAAGRQGLPAPS